MIFLLYLERSDCATNLQTNRAIQYTLAALFRTADVELKSDIASWTRRNAGARLASVYGNHHCYLGRPACEHLGVH